MDLPGGYLDKNFWWYLETAMFSTRSQLHQVDGSDAHAMFIWNGTQIMEFVDRTIRAYLTNWEGLM